VFRDKFRVCNFEVVLYNMFMTTKITKAIIPVAGLGTRFLPATKAQPKEMLTVVDKPVIQYLVEDAVASGIREIIFVTGRSKRAIEDHFDYAPELEAVLRAKKKTKALQEVRAISDLATFTYVRQKEPKGVGDAILCAAHLVRDEPVAVIFGDDILYTTKTPALRQLMSVYEKYGDSVVALEKVSRREVSRYGVVDPLPIDARTCEVKGLVEKPNPKDAPSTLVLTGMYLITPDVMDELTRVKPMNGELYLTHALEAVAKKRSVYGYELDGIRYDCGSKIGLLKATVDFGLRHSEVKDEFRKFLKTRM